MPVINLRTVTLPPGLRGPLLVGIAPPRPRFWATVWAATDGAHYSASSLIRQLSAIDKLYHTFDELFGRGSLDDALADLDFDRLEVGLGARFSQVQNDMAIRGITTPRTWGMAYEFVKSTVYRLSQTEPHAAAANRINQRIVRIERLYSSLRPTRRMKPPVIRALPAQVIEDIYSIIDPDSPRNPFRVESQRWRNFALIMLYLHQGLRRGEALILPANAVREGIQPGTNRKLQWINVVETGEDDERSEQPAVKTAQSRRQIPISSELAQIMRTYSMNWRGRQPHGYLFGSNRGHPLSLRSVNQIFSVISSSLCPAAKASLRSAGREPHISPHDLRHTSAVMRLTQFVSSGDEMELAIQKLRAFFGWSITSEMPRLYAKAYFESKLAAVWDSNFDAHVDALRRIDLTIG